MNQHIPILGFSAWSGTGKTTLLEQLIPLLTEAGISTGLIKHAHHNFDIDTPGKDSYRLRQAGANPVLIISDRRLAFLQESTTTDGATLSDALAALPDNSDYDLLLVEGFKNADIPKIVLHRQDNSSEDTLPTALDDPNVIALACDNSTEFITKYPASKTPILDINQAAKIAVFIQQWLQENNRQGTSCYSSDNSLQSGLDLIHAHIKPVQATELLSLPKALGRVLASSINAAISVPGDDNSAMDGYACSFADIENQSQPGLQLIGESACGSPFAGSVATGQCVRIFTGGMLPQGCDTVIMQEHSRRADNTIYFQAPIDRPWRKMQHVRLAGEDIATGSVIGTKGERLQAALLGVLASAGIMEVSVLRKPKVAFITNGNELIPLGQKLARGECYDSNRYTLQSLLEQSGVEVIDLGIVGDDPNELETTIKRANTLADMVITTGGISVGDADFVKPVISNLGEIIFSGLAIKPGHPISFARLENSHFFGLPGNPVAVMVCFSQLVLPAIRRMSGLGEQQALTLLASCEENIRKLPGRFEFVRGIVSTDNNGNYRVKRAGKQGSAILSTMHRANCFILLGESCNGVSTGQAVRIQPFQGF